MTTGSCIRCMDKASPGHKYCTHCDKEVKKEAEANRLIMALEGRDPHAYDELTQREKYDMHVLNECPEICGFCQDELDEVHRFMNESTFNAIEEAGHE